jgi:hypothetical protein
LNTLEGKNASHRISTSVRENWLQIMTIEKNRNGPTKSCTRKSLIRNLRTELMLRSWATTQRVV